MAVYVFVGTRCEIGDHAALKRIGDTINLTSEEAAIAIAGNAQILTAAGFAGIGFTAEELAMYGTPATQLGASEEFWEKLTTARALVGHEEE